MRRLAYFILILACMIAAALFAASKIGPREGEIIKFEGQWVERLAGDSCKMNPYLPEGEFLFRPIDPTKPMTFEIPERLYFGDGMPKNGLLRKGETGIVPVKSLVAKTQGAYLPGDTGMRGFIMPIVEIDGQDVILGNATCEPIWFTAAPTEELMTYVSHSGEIVVSVSKIIQEGENYTVNWSALGAEYCMIDGDDYRFSPNLEAKFSSDNLTPTLGMIYLTVRCQFDGGLEKVQMEIPVR